MNDKNRLLAVFLNCDPATANWDKASHEFGAASTGSMKVMVRTVLKKIEAAGGKDLVDSSPDKITKTPTSSKGKRKAQPSIEEDGNDAEKTPSKKKKTGYSKVEKDEEKNEVDDSGDADGIDSDMTKDEVGQVKEESDILC
ncbi:hypothetical protein M433DRAFT_1989 [Acidomyces richmondensis BFW]|nr:hypothetical protein M433DRAFT_1989 [Acidomyces richmondensis BFW]